jgi:hypothetical protein
MDSAHRAKNQRNIHWEHLPLGERDACHGQTLSARQGGFFIPCANRNGLARSIERHHGAKGMEPRASAGIVLSCSWC